MSVTVQSCICHTDLGDAFIYLFIYLFIYRPFNGALNVRNCIVAIAKMFNE